MSRNRSIPVADLGEGPGVLILSKTKSQKEEKPVGQATRFSSRSGFATAWKYYEGYCRASDFRVDTLAGFNLHQKKGNDLLLARFSTFYRCCCRCCCCCCFPSALSNHISFNKKKMTTRKTDQNECKHIVKRLKFKAIY